MILVGFVDEVAGGTEIKRGAPTTILVVGVVDAVVEAGTRVHLTPTISADLRISVDSPVMTKTMRRTMGIERSCLLRHRMDTARVQ